MPAAEMDEPEMLETIAALEVVEALDIRCTINGQAWQGSVPVDEVLLDFLRERLHLTGTKRSCESEICGACSVLLDGAVFSSCNLLTLEIDGKALTTIEGLADGDQLTPLQEAFVRNVGGQCGYCTPGQIIAATALLAEQPAPTYEQIAEWMRGNVCRCGSYPAIAKSVREAAASTSGQNGTAV